MPSSDNYVRDYDQETKTAKARGETGGSSSGNSQRKRLRRKALKLGMVKKGQDLDHRRPLSKGGANSIKNARAVSPGANRSFQRNRDGSIK